MALKKRKKSEFHNNIYTDHRNLRNYHKSHKNYKLHSHPAGSDASHNRNKRIVIAGIALFLIFAIIGGIAFALEDNLSLAGIFNDSSEDYDEDIGNESLFLYDEIYSINNKYETFLFIGTDNSGNEDGVGEDYQGSLADYLMLMIIDHTDDTYAFLPVDRNTIADIPLIEKDGSGEASVEAQICTAHWYGGNKEMSCENTVKAVSEYLGELPIDGYFAISMSEIPLINHLIGGVTVNLTDDFTDKDPEMKKGVTLTLSDEQAEIYIRGRMGLDDDTNKNRMSRQRTYMSAALKKIKENLKRDPDYFQDVFGKLSETATSTITGKQISRAANALAKNKDLGTFDIQGKTKLGEILGDGEKHEEFYPDQESVIEVMSTLYHLEKEEE